MGNFGVNFRSRDDMLRRAAVALVLGLVLAGGPTAHASAGCDSNLASAGLCGSNDGSSVTITGDKKGPQSPAAPSTPGGASDPSGPAAPEDTRPVCTNVIREDCRKGLIRIDAVPSPAPGAPEVTISDVASFAPAAPITLAEPSGLGVAGRPANFVATASVHTREGTILGAPVTVRFTPSAYSFDYGDGTSATRPTGGATWSALSQAAFTPTDTSHVYEHRGEYTSTVTVHYTADVDLGSGWIPLDGTLPVASPPQTIRIFEAHTALVHHTFTEDPDAPGC